MNPIFPSTNPAYAPRIISPRIISPRRATTVLPYLNIDVLVQIVGNMTPKEISNLCGSSPQFAELCRSDEFYIALIHSKYGVTINNVPGLTLRDKFNYLSQFDWRNIPGTTGNEKLRVIVDILEKAKTNKFKTVPTLPSDAASFMTRTGRGVSAGYINVAKDDITEMILMDAYKTGDFNFFMIVLDSILAANPILIKGWNIEYKAFSFILFRIVIESIKMKNYDFAEKLLDYLAKTNYNGQIDVNLAMVLDEIFTSDEDRKFLSKYIWTD